MESFSFASGSSTLPPLVRAALTRDVDDWHGSGFSALELPFTGQAFGEILATAEDDLRLLLDLPASYRVLFLQGGASAQFTLLPMNLLGHASHCDYVQSGYWSRRAIEEAAAYCDARVIATGSDTHLPRAGTWRQSADAAYCHFTSNETADGLQFHSFPQSIEVPLVADMTADFLTRPIPVERFGLIYASAQKNLGARVLPPNLAFRQNRLGEPLPLADASVDLIYSWSVFEHVADVPGVLAEFARITKPGGVLFIQVEPLFHGPYGSHLQRLVDEPWAHLRLGEEEFLRRAASARDEIPEHEKDTLYRDHSFEELKRYLLGEYRSLNRITADDLIRAVSAAGFDIAATRLIEPEGLEPDAGLLQRYPRELLLTNQIVLTARRSASPC